MRVNHNGAIGFCAGLKWLDKIKFQLDSSSFNLGYLNFFQKDSQFFVNIEYIHLLSPSICVQIFSHKTDLFAVREHHGNANIYHGGNP